MLRFSGALAPLVDARIEIDTGPIISAEFGGEHSGTLYWHAMDGPGGMLEIGVDEWTATLRSISLLTLPTKQVYRASYSAPSVPTHSASPVIDMSPWSGEARRGEDWGGRYIDEDHSLRLVASETGLSLRLLPEAPISVAHLVGNVRVGWDSDRFLRRVDLDDLTSDQLAAFWVGEKRRAQGGGVRVRSFFSVSWVEKLR